MIGNGSYGKLVMVERNNGNETLKVVIKAIEANDQNVLNESII